MAYSEFYTDPVNGSNLNAGSSEGSPAITSTGGNWVQAPASGKKRITVKRDKDGRVAGLESD